MTAERHHSAPAEPAPFGSRAPVSPTEIPASCMSDSVSARHTTGWHGQNHTGASGGYPFKPPVVRPDMMFLWKIRKNSTVGIAAMTAAATTTFIGVPPENA